MSEKSLLAKIEFILEIIEKIESVIFRHGGVYKSLEDFEGQMAILMGLAQVRETISKIDDKLLDKYDLLDDKKGSYSVRNYIVHDYDGVDLGFIESILKQHLPKLKIKIINIKENEF